MQQNVAPLGLIVMNGMQELGDKIVGHLQNSMAQNNYKDPNITIEAECPRFTTGDSKGIIQSTIRGRDLFILVDVGNYSCTYNMFGTENRMSPDDHYQNLKRVISAASGKAYRINVLMPILYGGRQHRREYRESLDGALALQELERIGVANIITFDAHDPRIQNAIPLMGFDNVMPTYQVLKSLFRNVKDLHIDPARFSVVAPDEGAIRRNMYYASVLGVPLGIFYKQRDFSRVVRGRNPIIAHEYLGEDLTGRDVFVADDIISTGDSMLDIAYDLKKRGAARIFIFATYALFTAGLEPFDKAVREGCLHGVFGTNLTYRPTELLSRAWFHEVDMSKYIAYFVNALNHNISITDIIDPHAKIKALLEKHQVQ